MFGLVVVQKLSVCQMFICSDLQMFDIDMLRFSYFNNSMFRIQVFHLLRCSGFQFFSRSDVQIFKLSYMFRYSEYRIGRCSNAQIHISKIFPCQALTMLFQFFISSGHQTNVQIFKCSNLQLLTDFQIIIFPDKFSGFHDLNFPFQIFRFMFRFSNVQILRCSGFQNFQTF